MLFNYFNSGINLCISILEFKDGNKEQEDLDAAKFMYFYIRI